MSFWKRASRNQRQAWKVGAGVIVGGAVFKVRNLSNSAVCIENGRALQF